MFIFSKIFDLNARQLPREKRHILNFFSKEPSKRDLAGYGVTLAKEARVDIVFENSNYGGFTIFLDKNNSSLTSHFKRNEERTAFLQAIEARISKEQFGDKNNNMSMGRKMRVSSGWRKKLNVRTVMGRENEPVFAWNAPQEY